MKAIILLIFSVFTNFVFSQSWQKLPNIPQTPKIISATNSLEKMWVTAGNQIYSLDKQNVKWVKFKKFFPEFEKVMFLKSIDRSFVIAAQDNETVGSYNAKLYITNDLINWKTVKFPKEITNIFNFSVINNIIYISNVEIINGKVNIVFFSYNMNSTNPTWKKINGIFERDNDFELNFFAKRDSSVCLTGGKHLYKILQNSNSLVKETDTVNLNGKLFKDFYFNEERQLITTYDTSQIVPFVIDPNQAMRYNNNDSNWVRNTNFGQEENIIFIRKLSNGSFFTKTNTAGVFNLYLSNDGLSWNTITANGIDDKDILDFYLFDSEYLIFNNNGIFLSKDKGLNFVPIVNGIETETYSDILGFKNKLFTFSQNEILYESKENINWEISKKNSFYQNATFIFTHHDVPYYSGYNYSFSNDTGNTWLGTESGTNSFIGSQQIKTIGYDNKYIYQLFKDNNSTLGISENKIKRYIPPSNVYEDVTNFFPYLRDSIIDENIIDNVLLTDRKNLILVGNDSIRITYFSDNKIYSQSVLDGTIWQDAKQGLPVGYKISIIRNSNNKLIGIFDIGGRQTGYEYKSNFWKKIFETDFSAENLFFYNKILYTTSSTGVYYSATNGNNWVKYADSLPTPINITGMTFLDSTIYISTLGKGLYKNKAIKYEEAILSQKNATFNNTLSIYPNPATSTLNLATSQNGIVTITNILGQEVLNMTYISGQALDIEALTQGTYILKLRTTAGMYVGRFVK